MASSNPPQDNDKYDDKDKDDAIFRRDYAKALGEALRQADDEQQQQQQSSTTTTTMASFASPASQQMIFDTYRQLCHDDPVVSAVGCHLLAKALIQSSSSSSSTTNNNNNNNNTYALSAYALSERLVEGLQQLLSSSSFTTRTSAAEDTASTVAENIADELNETATDADKDAAAKAAAAAVAGESAAQAAAELAWTVYGRIPLQCCLAGTSAASTSTSSTNTSSNKNKTHLETAAALLGSYRGPARAQLDQAAELEPTEPTTEADEPTEATAGEGEPPPPHDADNGNGNDNDAPNAPAPVAVAVEETEVWAAESDPSDFDFGESDMYAQNQQEQLEAWARAVEIQTDPVQLSKVPADSDTTTWIHIAQAVTNLTAACSFSKIGALSLGQWKQLRVADDLTQLILLLLVAPTTTASSTASNTSSGGALWQCEPATHWQQLGLQPLAVFRDAALHFSQPASSQGSNADLVLTLPSVLALWEAYLQLLQTLIQVHAAQPPPKQQHTGADDNDTVVDVVVAPATWVGCSSLSSLCSHCISSSTDGSSNNNGSSRSTGRRQKGVHSKLITAVQQCVLQCSDDLTLLLETTTNTVVTKNPKNDHDAAGVSSLSSAIQWTFLPFFQILTQSPVAAVSAFGGGAPVLSNTNAQTLLNSGLFRQWLTVWWWEINKTDADAPTAIGSLIQQSIFSLCACSPTLLGKYAWRYPGLAARVTSATTTNSTTVDGGNHDNGSDRQLDVLLWNLLGIHLAKQDTSTTVSKVQWKNAKQNTVAAAPTDQICQQAAWLGFQALCLRLTETLSDWKKRRQENLPTTSNFSEQQRVAASFVQLTDILVATPLLTTIFTERMMLQQVSSEEGDHQALRLATIRVELGPIQHCLAHWPAAPVSHDAKVKADDPEEEEEDMVELSKAAPRVRIKSGAEDESVDMVRRSVKVLVSLLDSSSNGPTSSFSSKAD
jgi:hypothetical protein